MKVHGLLHVMIHLLTIIYVQMYMHVFTGHMHGQRTDNYQTHTSSTHVKRPSVLLTKHDCRLAKMVNPIHSPHAIQRGYVATSKSKVLTVHNSRSTETIIHLPALGSTQLRVVKITVWALPEVVWLARPSHLNTRGAKGKGHPFPSLSAPVIRWDSLASQTIPEVPQSEH